MADMWVTATRDFGYDDELTVKNGQVFKLRGYVNDGLLLKHNYVVALEPQPKNEADLSAFPLCGECGRYFATEWQRDRCGRAHELEKQAVSGRRGGFPDRKSVQVVDPRTRAAEILRRRGQAIRS